MGSEVMPLLPFPLQGKGPDGLHRSRSPGTVCPNWALLGTPPGKRAPHPLPVIPSPADVGRICIALPGPEGIIGMIKSTIIRT